MYRSKLNREIMETLIGLLVSLTWLSGVVSSNQLVQSDAVVIKPGNSHTLTCQGSGGFTFAGYTMYWIRQFPEGKLQWLCYINSFGNTNYHDNVKGRFTATRDDNNNKLTLKMDNMKPEDTSMYYCARDSSSWYFDIWGPGTPVTVTSVLQITPQVFPLIPFGQDMKNTVTAGCLALKYFPNPLSVAWSTTTGQTLSEEKHFQFPLSGSTPSYSFVSQITVSRSDWASKSYRCDVKHFSKSIQKIVPSGCVQLPTSPSVQILQKPCVSNNNDQVELSCQAYNLTVQNPQIQWFINEQLRPLAQELINLEKVNNFHGIHSTVNIPPGEWSNGARIKCKVTDTKTKKSSEASARKCSENFNCLGIKVIMIPPTIEQLYVHKTAPISCVAYDMKDTKKPSFQFNYPGAPARLDIQTEDFQLNQNHTYSVTSFLIVEPATWLSNKEFTCVFQYPGLSEPIITTISNKPEAKLVPPIVAVFPPTQEDLAKDELCTLTCTANGFYPNDLYIGWTEENMEISSDQQVNSGAIRNNGNQSFCATSLLSIPCSKWKAGASYGCVVGHEAIAMKLVTKSIDKNSGNPAVVNVSVTMSDTTLSCH